MSTLTHPGDVAETPTTPRPRVRALNPVTGSKVSEHMCSLTVMGPSRGQEWSTK